jgi:hypothetical protein
MRQLAHWRAWTIELKVWKIAAAMVVVPILVLWFRVVHQQDDILALSRNEVATDGADQRSWVGRFVNTNDQTLRDVAVTVDFLDARNHTVGKVRAEAPELAFGATLDLQAPLPSDAVRIRLYSVQWRMGRTAALMGPFRDPWEFGYRMVTP